MKHEPPTAPGLDADALLPFCTVSNTLPLAIVNNDVSPFVARSPAQGGGYPCRGVRVRARLSPLGSRPSSGVPPARHPHARDDRLRAAGAAGRTGLHSPRMTTSPPARASRSPARQLTCGRRSAKRRSWTRSLPRSKRRVAPWLWQANGGRMKPISDDQRARVGRRHSVHQADGSQPELIPEEADTA
jgi:hypothetical protein